LKMTYALEICRGMLDGDSILIGIALIDLVLHEREGEYTHVQTRRDEAVGRRLIVETVNCGEVVGVLDGQVVGEGGTVQAQEDADESKLYDTPHRDHHATQRQLRPTQCHV